MGHGDVWGVAKSNHTNLPHFQHGKGLGDQCQSLKGKDVGTGLAHGFTVIHSDHDLIVALAGHGPSHPDLVSLVVRCDVRDDALDVESLPGAVVTAKLRGG